MPYWEHMGVFLKYFERLSYLMSQGKFVCDVAILYPVAPFEAGLNGKTATGTAFNTASALMAAGVNFEFVDADSLARAQVRNGRLEVADSSYRALVLPALEAVRWASMEKANALAKAGGLVLSVGSLPFASDRAGRDDKQLDALVAETVPENHRLSKPSDVPAAILASLTPDTRADKPIRSLHRKVGPRDVYMVMDAPKGSAVEFRAKGQVELWDPWTGAAQPLRVLGQTATGTKVELPLENYEAQIVVFTPGSEHVNPPPRQERPVQEIALDGQWEFELKPTMDNRYGDFRLPAYDKIIGPEARIFRHAVESGDTKACQSTDFDDSRWERATYDFGPQFWLLGPIPAGVADNALDSQLAKLVSVNPKEPVTVAGKPMNWRPYCFSWRQGFEGDPGHQGYHGLKENVTDHFLCLGKRGGALNETTYGPEIPGGRYYLYTFATVEAPTLARIVAPTGKETPRPHASQVLTPAAVFVNGARLDDFKKAVSLRAGANPILVRYDQAGRGYFVLKRDGADAAPGTRTPLSMTWFDDRSVIRFDMHAGAKPAEWFRFTAPPGLRAMAAAAKGSVEAWADGKPMRAAGKGRYEPASPLSRPAVVAIRAVPQTGFAGAAVFPEPIKLECGPGVATLGDWSKAGALECYSGGAWYRKTVTLTPEQARGEVALDLGKVVATAEVRVNGQLAGIRVAPPWRVDISKQVKPGENRVEVLVFNTLANHYLTIPTRYRGEPTSGLLGPVTLRVAVAPAKDEAPAKSVLAPGAKVAELAKGFQFTEGPAMDKQGNVLFSDVQASRTYKWSPDGKVTLFRENTGRANGLAFDAEGNLLACEGANGRVVAVDAKGNVTVVADAYQGKRFNAPNDLWIDPKGGVYFTDPLYGRGEKPQGGEHVYYVTPGRKKVIRVIDDMVRPNGLAGTPDGKTLYVADHGAGKTYRYAVNADGTLADKTLFAPNGSDGMKLDRAGNLYITTDAVLVYSPAGMQIARIEVPQQPTNVCFAGSGPTMLFITARSGIYAVQTAPPGGAGPSTRPSSAPPAGLGR
jgi:sugar lactone lactonase YvrE